MYRIVFSDVDGTLLNAQRQISPRTVEAIHALTRRGIPFVIASARCPSAIEPILTAYSLQCPIIAYSGALILDADRRMLYHKGFDKARAQAVLRLLDRRDFDLAWCIYALDQWLVADRSHPRIRREEEIVGIRASEGTLNDVEGEEISKLLCMCAPGQIDGIKTALERECPDLTVVQSSDTLLEIMAGGVHKGAALRRLCVLWGIPTGDAVAFGDNENDLAMLREAGRGYLMGNAPAGLKAICPHHTADNDHDGIYLALKELGLVE